MKKGTVIQTVAAVLASSGGFLSGTAVAWPECVEEQVLKKDALKFSVTDEQYYWAGLIVRIGAIIGCMFAGVLIEYLGRKFTIVLANAPYILGYIVLILAKDFKMLIWSRFLIGVTIGSLSVAVPIYVREISEKDIRGALGTLYYLFYCFGFFFAALLGYLCPVLILNVILLLFPVLCNIPLIFMPESPVFLISRDKVEKAEAALGVLRIKEDMDEHMMEMKEELEAAGGRRELFNPNPFKDQIGFRSFVITAGMMSFLEFSGMSVIWRSGKRIVALVDHTYNSGIVLIIIGAIMFGTVPFATYTIDRIGRRILLFASAVGSAASLLLTGIYLVIRDYEPASMDYLSPALIFLLILCITTANMGVGPVSWVLLGEMFTIEIKALTGTLSAIFYWLFSFLIPLLGNALASTLGLGWGVVFTVLGVFMILAAIFVAFCVVETKHSLRRQLSSALRGRSRISSLYRDLVAIKSTELDVKA